jgi:hypothetical protein
MIAFPDMDDLDYNVVGVALILYLICIVLIWKAFDQNIMKIHIKLILSVFMLPISYFLVSMMANK